MPEHDADYPITLEVLPAGYGDCLLITCPVPDGQWRLLVDTGPDETWPALYDRLARLPLSDSGHRYIDLLIVSHIDHDHIGGTRDLFRDTDLSLSFGDIWFNGRRHLDFTPDGQWTRGVAEGEQLSETLADTTQKLPWNVAFGGGPVVTPGDGAHLLLPTKDEWPRLTLLSPTPKRLARLRKVWDRELEKLRKRESDAEGDRERSGAFPDLEALAAHKSSKDRSAANGSSIALLLEHCGCSLLLAADAYATVVGSALLGLAKARGVTPPLHVDAFKLSHHGSRGNLILALLGALRADDYVISTNNDRFRHPHDETLARVILYGGKKPRLWFNYRTGQNLRWQSLTQDPRNQFEVHFPPDGKSGITLPIPYGHRGSRLA